ncbi:phage terminase large subunit [Paenibacillus kandeliae]|uniref:phage terminase large subunit n=1 Tax=Paenibacillus kandeliae TaxID=3231269 RepID=UPI0034593550
MSLSAAEELELIQLLEDEERYEAATDYYAYVRYVHGNMYTYTRHGEYVCNILNDAVVKRKMMLAGELPMETQYFMISMPPQHGKSMHITETFPSFFLGNFPDEGVIEVSYNEGFAEKFGGKNKDKLAAHGSSLFGVELAGDTRSKSEWGVSKDGKKTRGGMISRGIMSGVTGSSWGDCIIIDDPIKNREEANSDTMRDKQWQEWIDSLSTRIHPGAIVIVIMTRWHEDDLCGRLLNREYAEPLPWRSVNLPLEAEEDDELGRLPGDPLWPERYGHDFIRMRKAYPSSFNALYQGRPTSQEGNVIKRDWWQYYDDPRHLPVMATKLISVDAAFKGTDDSDFVVVQVWGKRDAYIYLIDQVRAKMNFTATVQTIQNMSNKHPDAYAKLVEDKANGSAIIDTLHTVINGIIPVNPEGGKVARVNAVLPTIEAKQVFLPRGAEWVHDFVEEAASFPNGKNDDQVDAMSQALHRFLYAKSTIPEEQRDQTPYQFRSNLEEPSGYVDWSY